MDVSEAALAVAGAQDFAHGLKACGAVAPVFVKADVLDTEQSFDYGVFDLVLSNPPYLTESERPLMHRNVVDNEPGLALFVPGSDPLLFHRAIARWSGRFLGPEGRGLTEINERLGKETEGVFRASGFPHTLVRKDIFDRNRFVVYFGAEGFAVGDGLVVGCDGDRPGVDGKRYRSGTDEGIYPPHNFIIGDSGNDNISRTGICVVRITTNCNPISEIKIIW